LGSLQYQDALLEFRRNFRLIEFFVELELAKEIDQLVLTINRFAHGIIRRFGTNGATVKDDNHAIEIKSRRKQ